MKTAVAGSVGCCMVFLFSLVLQVAVNPVWAQQPTNPFEKALDARFQSMDTDKDGKVDFEEYKSSYDETIKTSFDRRDADKDGALTRDEFMLKSRSSGTRGTGNPFLKMKQGEDKDSSAAE